MKKKSINVFLVLLAVLIFASGCQSNTGETQTSEDYKSEKNKNSDQFFENDNSTDQLSEDKIEDTLQKNSDDTGYEEVIETYMEGLYNLDGEKILSVYPQKPINAHLSLHWTGDRAEFGVWHAEGARRSIIDTDVELLMEYKLGTITDLPEDMLQRMETVLEEEIVKAYGEDEAEDINITSGKEIQVLLPISSLTEYVIKIDNKWYLCPFSINIVEK